MTIWEAASEVLKSSTSGMTSGEITDVILQKKLYEFHTDNPISMVNAAIRRHCEGLDFPAASVIKYFKIAGKKGKATTYVLADSIVPVPSEGAKSDMLPEERIQQEHDEYLKTMGKTLLDGLLVGSPALFERIVVRLMLRMGYGYDANAGVVTGKPHDGGIDGIIFEDTLGLSKIYLQAKRYKVGSNIGCHELQSFVGAMQSVSKGVFVTTSDFTKEAKQYAESQQQKSLRLINGEELCQLLLKHNVGVQATSPMYFYSIDSEVWGQ